MNDERSQLNIINDIVNDKKGHNIANDSFAHNPERLLVDYRHQQSITIVHK